MDNICDRIREHLLGLKDQDYREFQGKLIPEIDPDRIIGVRMPLVRKYAMELKNNPETEIFLHSLPHEYYDENNLHGVLIEGIKDFDRCIEELDRFLPYVDNWATCDLMTPKVLGKHKDETIVHIRRWLSSGKTYTIRFGIDMLMRFYLDEDFRPEYFDLVTEANNKEYYVNMAVAWYFATALSKQYDEAVRVFEERKISDASTHNRAIQKARESFRVPPEHKEYLKTLKIS